RDHLDDLPAAEAERDPGRAADGAAVDVADAGIRGVFPVFRGCGPNGQRLPSPLYRSCSADPSGRSQGVLRALACVLGRGSALGGAGPGGSGRSSMSVAHTRETVAPSFDTSVA